MKVKSVQEALDLFLASKRIVFDIDLDLRFVEEFSTHVIVRPWRQIPLFGNFFFFFFVFKIKSRISRIRYQ
jgi:hypothetical protein